MAEMRLVRPQWFGVEDFRSELSESHINLKQINVLIRGLFAFFTISHLQHNFHERSVVVRRQVFFGGMNQTTARCEKLLDEGCVVAEVGGDKHNVVLVVSAQELVKERRLFDALFVKVCLKAVVGESDNFVGTCKNKLKFLLVN